MTSLAEMIGRPVVSRSSADVLGTLQTVVVDANRRAMTALQVGRGRRARFVEHRDIRAVGPDAIVVDDPSVLRPAAGPVENAAAKGKLDILSAPVFTSTGIAAGRVVDVDLDLDAGLVTAVVTEAERIAGQRILGFGRFALVVDVPAAEGRPVPG